MTRSSDDYYQDGRLWDGYDYENQAWVKDGKYVSCGHPESMDCQCYGRLHAGEKTIAPKMGDLLMACIEKIEEARIERKISDREAREKWRTLLAMAPLLLFLEQVADASLHAWRLKFGQNDNRQL